MGKLRVYLDTSVISHLPLQERIDYYNKRGLEVHKKIQEHKSQKAL